MLNKKFLLSAPIFVLVLVLGVSALDTVHTPAKGSAERNAIMDGLRAEYKKMSGPDDRAFRGAITFNVTFLKVHNGWAWIYAEPQSTDRRDAFGENSGFLLQLEAGRWNVKSLPAMVDDPDDPENLDYPSKKDVTNIRRAYPGVPSDIFPSHDS